MKNIVLFCSAGMSTSLLVTKMQKYANEKGYDLNIWAVPVDEATTQVPKADVVLLGPQIRHMKDEIKKLTDEQGINVEVIPLVEYGTMQGDKVVELALSLIK